MRLWNHNDEIGFSLTDFSVDPFPKYAIRPHTWEVDEVTFKDLRDGIGISKVGYEKISFCGNQARADNLEYF
jgi:hypothetical protein